MRDKLTLEECQLLIEKWGDKVIDLIRPDYVEAIQDYYNETPKTPRDEKLEIRVGLRGASTAKNTSSYYLLDEEGRLVGYKSGQKNKSIWVQA